MDKKLIICVGISGSGKSSYTRNLLRSDSSFIRINRDDLRLTLVGNLTNYYKRKDIHKLESIVTELEENIFISAKNIGKNIIIDNTNLNEKAIIRWLNLALKYGYNIEFKFFESSIFKSKLRVFWRDFNFNNLSYIEKQFKQYQTIKQKYEK